MKIIDLLEKLLDDDTNIEIQNEINNLEIKNLEEILMNLNHYFSDSDIRAKDKNYKLFQNEELKKLIRYLKSNDIKRANEISFLQKS